MTSNESNPRPLRVVIAGGGVVALECGLALSKLARDRVAITLLAPDDEFVEVPGSVGEPFAAGRARRRSLARFAADVGADLRKDSLAWVAPGQRSLFTTRGKEIAYDELVVGLGAKREPVYERVITFRGPEDTEAVHGLVQDVEGGYTRRVAFVVPPGVTWPLPLYELALQTATRAREMGTDVELTVVSPEPAPLGVFGSGVSTDVLAQLRDAGVRFEGGVEAAVEDGSRVFLGGGRELDVDRVVALPRLQGRGIRGLPADAGGFIPVDRRGRVRGCHDVYAAGDGIASEVKQGGVAAHQADLIAELIARRAGADVELSEVPPTLRATLVTGSGRRFLRGAGAESEASDSPMWWPPAKIAGRYLAPYLVGQ
jgi:sulfide:quinone oxidoreductase